MIDNINTSSPEISISGRNSLVVRTVENYARFSLRIALKDVAPVSRSFGPDLPTKIGNIANSGGRSALCLGPDEWQLSAPLDEANAIKTAFAAAYSDCVHSLVDIGHREIAIQVEGSAATILLSAGCPLNLETMPADSGTRTIFEKIPIILTKYSDTRFRVEVSRSFAPHLWGILEAVSYEIQLNI